MEMENIFKSISDTVTEIENEKEAVEDTANKKQVNRALEGIKDLKEIIHYIMKNFESKEKIREMNKASIFKLSYQGKHQRIDIEDQPWGTTKYSPLFENEFVDSIYKRGNLKQIVLALSYDETELMLLKELDGNLIKNNSRNFDIGIDGCWFRIFIKSGILNDTIGQISFLVN